MGEPSVYISADFPVHDMRLAVGSLLVKPGCKLSAFSWKHFKGINKVYTAGELIDRLYYGEM